MSIGKNIILRKTHRLIQTEMKLTWAELNAHKKMPESKKKILQNEHWKNSYFRKHPSADTNKDGVLSWPELHAHRKKQ